MNTDDGNSRHKGERQGARGGVGRRVADGWGSSSLTLTGHVVDGLAMEAGEVHGVDGGVTAIGGEFPRETWLIATKSTKVPYFLSFLAFSPILARKSRTRQRLQEPERHGCHDTWVIGADETSTGLNRSDPARLLWASDLLVPNLDLPLLEIRI